MNVGLDLSIISLYELCRKRTVSVVVGALPSRQHPLESYVVIPRIMYRRKVSSKSPLPCLSLPNCDGAGLHGRMFYAIEPILYILVEIFAKIFH